MPMTKEEFFPHIGGFNMAILPRDFNPNELIMYLKKKNPSANISYEINGSQYTIFSCIEPNTLKIPNGWHLRNNYLTNQKRIAATTYYYIKVVVKQ